jgi:hypothetical protein
MRRKPRSPGANQPWLHSNPRQHDGTVGERKVRLGHWCPRVPRCCPSSTGRRGSGRTSARRS